MGKIISILEEKGCSENLEYKIDGVKQYVMGMLERSKKGIDPTVQELMTVRNSIEMGDHHDMIRVDQVLTRMANREESEYQWGSVVLGLKMKM